MSDEPALSDGKASPSPEALIAKTNRFYARYGAEVENLRLLVEVHLHQIVLAYCLDNRLPRESIDIKTRVKPLTSFIEKLERHGWPDFYYPTDVIQDLIGARAVCWFIEDCYGLLRFLKESHQFVIRAHSVEDYIARPKASGYRAVHVLADFTYDAVARSDGRRRLTSASMVCEMQLRTRLQDAFGQMTHEFPYKETNEELARQYEQQVGHIAEALSEEDKRACALRPLVQGAFSHEKRVGVRG